MLRFPPTAFVIHACTPFFTFFGQSVSILPDDGWLSLSAPFGWGGSREGEILRVMYPRTPRAPPPSWANTKAAAMPPLTMAAIPRRWVLLHDEREGGQDDDDDDEGGGGVLFRPYLAGHHSLLVCIPKEVNERGGRRRRKIPFGRSLRSRSRRSRTTHHRDERKEEEEEGEG
jgi:hypothetical protein